MTANHDLERRLADHYAREGGVRAPDWVLGSALATIETTSQRRALVRVSWRFPTMNNTMRLAAAAVAVIAVAGIAAALSGQFRGPGGPATPSPSLTPSPLTIDQQALTAGRYALAAGFPARTLVTVPDGWETCSASPVEQGLCHQFAAGRYIGFAFLDVVNVVKDPCSEALRDPPVGPSVDDLVTAISTLKGFTATTAEATTLVGYPGERFAVTAPSDSGCDLKTWATNDRVNGVGLGETNELRVVDVAGERILIALAYDPTIPEEQVDAARRIIDGVQFEP